MDAELKLKWVAALRSGEFKQAKKKLTLDGGHCCLGVLCRVVGYGIDEEWDDIIVNGAALSYVALSDLGLNSDQRSSLIEMNDSGKPFSEIADYIEANL